MYIVNSSKSYAQVIALLNIKITVHTLRTIYPQSINIGTSCLAELASIAVHFRRTFGNAVTDPYRGRFSLGLFLFLGLWHYLISVLSRRFSRATTSYLPCQHWSPSDEADRALSTTVRQ